MSSFCGLGKSKFRSRLKVEKEIKLGISAILEFKFKEEDSHTEE